MTTWITYLVGAGFFGGIAGAIASYLVNRSKLRFESNKMSNDFAVAYASLIKSDPEKASSLAKQFAAGILILKDEYGSTVEKYFIPIQCKVYIGRGDDNDIILHDKLVSRDHAVIYYKHDYFIIQDLAPINPTIVDGTEISPISKLTSSSIITIGDKTLEFRSLI